MAAGIVTPVLSLLFAEIGLQLSWFDIRGLRPIFVLMPLPLAAVLGAPLAIPASLLIRLRNLWLSVPLISLVSAVGIAAQIALSRVFENFPVVATVLMLVWVVPAAFGTATALALRWKPALWILAAPIAVALALALGIPGAARARAVAPAIAAARAWSVLHVGMMVYTGGNTESGQVVCPSLDVLLASQRGQDAKCTTVPRGVSAVVDAIVPCQRTDPDWGYETPHVQIHARDGSWQGFTDAGGLQPAIPTGIPLSMHRDWGAPLVMVDDQGNQTTIGDAALVKLLRYDPKRDASLYVEILDGLYRGHRGWMSIQDADTGGVALGEYGVEYPYAACQR